MYRTRGICCCDSNGIREFFGMLVGCSRTGGGVEAFRKRVCKCCRPFFTRYFPPSKFGSNVGCHDWARAITTCHNEEEKKLEQTIRNNYNTTNRRQKHTLRTWLALPQRSNHCRIVQILRVFATAWGFPIQTDTGRGTFVGLLPSCGTSNARCTGTLILKCFC